MEETYESTTHVKFFTLTRDMHERFYIIKLYEARLVVLKIQFCL